MVDPDTMIPSALKRLAALCSVYAQAPDDAVRASFLLQIETTALDIGYIYAVDLIREGWTPDQAKLVTISKRLLAA